MLANVSDDLTASELVPRGGSWSGLVFSNPGVGYSTALTWRFSFDFEPIVRDYGDVEPGLTIEWAKVPDLTDWSRVAGLEVACTSFAEPVEASVYCFEHYRYDTVRLSVLDQDGASIRARAIISGDIDGLGIPDLMVEAWLTFEGVFVHLPEKPASVRSAAALLADYTDTDRLVGHDRGTNYVFVPAVP